MGHGAGFGTTSLVRFAGLEDPVDGAVFDGTRGISTGHYLVTVLSLDLGEGESDTTHPGRIRIRNPEVSVNDNNLCNEAVK
jgi:hypothetical protein